ncbi:TlpA family protein disulfide reductase [Motilimonas pumila]|uniref:TlpA family protein disulfide reductase n=1 Tax=Motilimonas pumila TaxID=2303987 RepID=A0A418YGX7_9GAMM|nr:TlpA disulfide reductase family protein [Motilimonas pumila]RJG49090.1 TlpA family protein disulfide reductase [Motilimonas pumila]
MKKWILTSLLSGLLMACSEPQLQIHDGNKAALSDYQGRWLLVNYYADWCKPCIKELPALDAFAKQQDKVAVLAISYDDLSLDRLRQSHQNKQVSFPFASVISHDFPLQRPKVLPTTYLLGPNQEVQDVLVGEQTLTSLNQVMAKHGIN